MPQTGTHRPMTRTAPHPEYGGSARVLLDGYECRHCGELYATVDEAHAAARLQCPEAPEPWSSWRINLKFLIGLRESFGDREITNKEAYKYYAHHHSSNWRGERTSWKDMYLQMNVRNHLGKAAYQGLLVRVAPGRYKFPSVE